MSYFRGRDWLFNHIFDNYLSVNQSSVNNLLFITGSIGSGKSSICHELINPLFLNNLNRSIKISIQSQIFMSHDFSITQNLNLSAIEFFKYRLNKLISRKFNLNSDVVSLNETLDLLNKNIKTNNNYLIIVDSIEPLLTNQLINDFISFIKDVSFSSCFKFIMTCRTDHFKSILEPRLINYEKICLDKKISVLSSSNFCNHLKNDVILLTSHILSKNKAIYDKYHNQIRDLCNDLLIKSDSNMLYVSRVMNLIVRGRIELQDLDKLPSNIHQFYLYLIDKIQMQSLTFDFDIVKSLFSLFQLDSNKPYSCYCLYKIVSSKYTNLDEKKFNQFFDFFKDLFLISIDYDNDKNSRTSSFYSIDNRFGDLRYKLFHSSLYEFINDLELCTKSYPCDQNEANELLAIYYWSKLCNFDFHFSRTSTPIIELNKLDTAFNWGDQIDNSFDFMSDIKYIDESESSTKSIIKNQTHLNYLNKFRFHLSKIQQTNELNLKLKYHCDYHHINNHFRSSTNLANIDFNFDDSSSMFESFKSKSPAKFSISSQILSQLVPLTDTINNYDESPTKLVRKSNKKIRFQDNDMKKTSGSSIIKNDNKCFTRFRNFLFNLFCCK